MNKPNSPNEVPLAARLVHRSPLVERDGEAAVYKVMLNLMPQGRVFEPGLDVGITNGERWMPGMRRYTIESVGPVPFEDSIDITLYVRDRGRVDADSVSRYLLSRDIGDVLTLFGPFPYPFYPPMGSRSNLILVGAGVGMVPFRWLARKIKNRRLDWMGKVLMLEGAESGLEKVYVNDRIADADQYFDALSFSAFDALKTRYSAIASDLDATLETHCDAVWRLMGLGSVYVYVAGYRSIAESFDQAMASHLRLEGRWLEAKRRLQRDGHWQEWLYD
jgi:NAD(P)H-flavin reductase